MRNAAAVILLLAIVVAAQAGAQSPVSFVDLEIDLWPEYDRPGVLVIYRGTIAPGVALPAAISLRIPAAAGPPNAVAERDPSGQLTVVQYDHRVDGDWATLTFVAARPVIQVEFYDPRIERQEALRTFAFQWPGDYQIGSLSFSVQQPDLAQNLSLDPPASSEGTSADGLLYKNLVFAGVEAGRTIDLSISFEKAADSLSIETMTPMQQVPPATSAPTSAGDSSLVVIVVGALLAAAVVIGAFLWRRPGAEAATPLHGGGPGPTARPQPGGGSFCTQCGNRADPQDRFCAACGTPLR